MSPDMEETADLLGKFIAEQVRLVEESNLQILENAIKWHEENCKFQHLHNSDKGKEICQDTFLEFFARMFSRALMMRDSLIQSRLN